MMVCGKFPFRDPDEISPKNLKESLLFHNPFISEECKHIILRLLEKNHKTRLNLNDDILRTWLVDKKNLDEDRILEELIDNKEKEKNTSSDKKVKPKEERKNKENTKKTKFSKKTMQIVKATKKSSITNKEMIKIEEKDQSKIQDENKEKENKNNSKSQEVSNSIIRNDDYNVDTEYGNLRKTVLEIYLNLLNKSTKREEVDEYPKEEEQEKIEYDMPLSKIYKSPKINKKFLEIERLNKLKHETPKKRKQSSMQEQPHVRRNINDFEKNYISPYKMVREDKDNNDNLNLNLIDENNKNNFNKMQSPKKKDMRINIEGLKYIDTNIRKLPEGYAQESPLKVYIKEKSKQKKTYIDQAILLLMNNNIQVHDERILNKKSTSMMELPKIMPKYNADASENKNTKAGFGESTSIFASPEANVSSIHQFKKISMSTKNLKILTESTIPKEKDHVTEQSLGREKSFAVKISRKLSILKKLETNIDEKCDKYNKEISNFDLDKIIIQKSLELNKYKEGEDILLSGVNYNRFLKKMKKFQNQLGEVYTKKSSLPLVSMFNAEEKFVYKVHVAYEKKHAMNKIPNLLRK